MTRRLGGFVLCAGAISLALWLPSAATAENCGTHLGQSVQLPPGLPPGSTSVQFVPGGTLWRTPDGEMVTVPQVTFPPCTATPPTNTPPPTTKAPPPTIPKSPSTPPPPTTTTPPPTTTSPPTTPAKQPTIPPPPTT